MQDAGVNQSIWTPRIGVLAIQGDYAAHAAALTDAGADPVEVRNPDELDALDGLILPGGIAISFCIGAMSSALSAWLWWKFGGWVVERLSLPVSIVAPGIFLFLLLPAVVIAALMLAFPQPVFESRFMVALAREREGDTQ